MVDGNSRRSYIKLLAAGAGTALAGCSSLGSPEDRDDPTPDTTTETPTPGDPSVAKIDDWQYEPGETAGGHSQSSGGGQATATSAPAPASSASGSTESIGLSAGGAKDIATFRRNVEEGYLPQPQSLAYEGLFYDYYFDTGSAGSCSSTFCPAYSPAVTPDPLSGETERYFTVGLHSGIDESEFERKQLNLVVVLDISGSMGSSFSEYYYDRFGNRHEPEGDTDTEKIEVARQALVDLTEQLRPDDRLGVVLYGSDASLAKPLRAVERTDMDAIRDHIREDIEAGGGTNLDAGLSTATDQLTEYSDADQSTTENRMLVLTDAMPNLGQTDDDGLADRLADHAEDNNIHTTFVGVGVDFNTELVDELTAIRGRTTTASTRPRSSPSGSATGSNTW
ncbi:VWA domain-containing protein [Halomicroarcula sp. GCM10025894]|uniref:vWA domain-containing protein n=1 Tax=Halomicroarcula sp. GCM10025894 TaxID=3252673 RepID=UPI00361B486D